MRPLLPLVIPATALALGIIIGKYLPSTPDAPAPKSPSAQEPAMPFQQGNTHPALPKDKRPSPEKVLEMAEMLPEGPQRLAFFENLLSSVKDNPELIKAILANLTPEQTLKMIEKNCEFLTQLDPEAAMAWIAQVPDSVQDLCVKKVANAYALRDSEAAFSWANKIADLYRTCALNEVLTVITATDAPGAMKKALSITNLHTQSFIVQSVAVAWAKTDAPAAFQNALSIADPGLQQFALCSIIPHVAESHPEGLERMLPQVAGSARHAVQTQLLQQKFQESMEAGIDYLFTLARSKEEQDVGIANASGHTLGKFWSERDPAAGASWLGQLPEGRLRIEATVTLAGFWMERDAIAASAWINTLPSGPEKDAIAYHFVDKLWETDSDRAAMWAGQIQEADVRKEACKWTFARWLQKDYAAAAQALQKVDVPEETKVQWLEEARPTVDSSPGK